MKNLKEIKVVVKTLVEKTYIINEDNGYKMPETIQETLDFIDNIKDEALRYHETDAFEIESHSQIESLEIIEW